MSWLQLQLQGWDHLDPKMLNGALGSHAQNLSPVVTSIHLQSQVLKRSALWAQMGPRAHWRPECVPFQNEKALSCHLILKHTPYKTSKQRTNPVTRGTPANCCRFSLLDGTHMHTHEGHHHTLGHRAQVPCGHWVVCHWVVVSFPVDTGLWHRFTPRSRAACRTQAWIPLPLLCALSVWGGAPGVLHLPAFLPPTLTASPALDHEEPWTANKPFSSAKVALMRSLGHVGPPRLRDRSKLDRQVSLPALQPGPATAKGWLRASPSISGAQTPTVKSPTGSLTLPELTSHSSKGSLGCD